MSPHFTLLQTLASSDVSLCRLPAAPPDILPPRPRAPARSADRQHLARVLLRLGHDVWRDPGGRFPRFPNEPPAAGQPQEGLERTHPRLHGETGYSFFLFESFLVFFSSPLSASASPLTLLCDWKLNSQFIVTQIVSFYILSGGGSPWSPSDSSW